MCGNKIIELKRKIQGLLKLMQEATEEETLKENENKLSDDG